MYTLEHNDCRTLSLTIYARFVVAYYPNIIGYEKHLQ